MQTNGVAVGSSFLRAATPAEAEEFEVPAVKRRYDGARVRRWLTGSPSTHQMMQGCPVVIAEALMLLLADRGVGRVLTAVSSGSIAAARAPSHRVWELRLARARLASGEALMRSAIVVEACFTRVAGFSESGTATLEVSMRG